MESVKALAELELGLPRVHHLLAALCLAAIIYKLTLLLVQRKQTQRNFENFPGPPPHWLFGHALQFKQDGTSLFTFLAWGQEYNYAVPFWFGPFFCMLHLLHPDYTKTIMTSPEPKDDMAYYFIKPWIGDGLLVSKGPRWFRNRRLLTPGFHYDVLKPYTKRMSESAITMLDKWERYADSSELFELFKEVSLMTLDSILKCAFSHNSNCQTESGTNPYIKAVYELSNLVNMRFRTFPYHSDIIFYLSPHGYRFRKACRIAHDHTDSVIRQRKEELKEETVLERIKAKRNLDFLDILLLARDENGQGLSDEDIRAEVETFMFEGHDTTASGMSFILYTLACNPEHQKICREEIIQVLDGKDTMDWEDLNKIPYTTMCIKESLRLYPPVPGIARKLTKPVKLIDGRTIAAGSQIMLSIWGLHRNPSVWENPHDYDPLRFLPENASKRSPHAFVPFSAGSRNCIGQTFAMNEMKVATALILKKYRLINDPAHEPKLIPRLVLRSLNGIHIRIERLEPKE